MHNDIYYKLAEQKLNRMVRNDLIIRVVLWVAVIVIVPVVLFVAAAVISGIN